VMNHKDCSKPLAQSASPRSPQTGVRPSRHAQKDSDERAEYATAAKVLDTDSMS
jgi:hypothetical protein